MEASRIEANDLLREARLERGWSVDRLANELADTAARVGGRFRGLATDPRTIRRWEAGERWPRSESIELLCVVFDATPTELGLVKRREFLKVGAATFGALAIGSPFDLERFSSLALGGRQLDPAFVEDLARLTEFYAGRLDVSSGGLLPEIRGHLNTLQTLLLVNAHPPSLARRIHALTGDTAVLASWVSFHLGNFGDAHRYAVFADQMASEAGDGPIRAKSLICRAFLHSPDTIGAPTGNGLSVALLTEAIEAAGHGAEPHLRAFALAERGVERAFVGEAEQGAADLESAARVVGQITSPVAGGLAVMDTARLDGYASKAALVSHAPSAADQLTTAYERTPKQLVTIRAQMQIDIAIAHHQDGEVEQAVRMLMDALAVSSQHGIAQALPRVAGLRHRLPSSDEVPIVRRLDEQLQAIA